MIRFMICWFWGQILSQLRLKTVVMIDEQLKWMRRFQEVQCSITSSSTGYNYFVPIHLQSDLMRGGDLF